MTRRDDFDRWLAELERRFENPAGVARAAGITHGAYTRQVRTGKLGLMPLLKLSIRTGEPAGIVLRRAGKEKLAELIESTFGQARVPTSPNVAALQRALEDLGPPERDRAAGILLQLFGLRSAPGSQPADAAPPASVPVAIDTGSRPAGRSRAARPRRAGAK